MQLLSIFLIPALALPVLSVPTLNTQYSVGLSNTWHVTVHLGTPPQELQMVFDTGAGSLAARSTLLPPNESPGGPAYDPSKSSTATQLQGYKYKNCYASGHCGSGIVYNDTVSVGNLKLRMAFEVATANNGQGSSSPDDSGDFGMAFASGGMSTTPKAIPTFQQSIRPLLESYLFTIDYNKTLSSGTVDFGFIDQNKYTGEIGYLPIQGDGFWGVNFTGYAVGNGPVKQRVWKSVVDSGTTTTAVPRDVVDAYFANIKGATYDSSISTYQFPCSATLPSFSFGIGSHTAVIPASYIKGGSIGSSGNCASQLRAGNDTVIFGQSFIQALFLVFDHGNARVGFANK